MTLSRYVGHNKFEECSACTNKSGEQPKPEIDDIVPIISGLLATRCTDENCYVKALGFSSAFSEWLCPHCGARLGSSNICLNLCGLSYPSAKRFDELLADANRP